MTRQNRALFSAFLIAPGLLSIDCSEDAAVCGDGVIDAGEECDTGRLDTAECNYAGGTNGYACTLAACGDGYLNTVAGEACDDGVNDGSYGGCNGNCTSSSYCGDGNQDPQEECDNGALNADSSVCTSHCAVARCGDGLLYAGVEVCDAGEQDTTECDYAGGDPYNGCTPPACGDGYLNPLAEECEVTSQDSDSCDYDDLVGPQACTFAVCGDNYTNAQAGEACDGGTGDTDTCDHDGGSGPEACSDAVCGDGYVNAERGETCDEGEANNSDDWLVGAVCNATCSGPGPHCGDGVVDAPYEECDAGQADTVACDYDGGTGLEACSLAACGDGYVNAERGEACDDGAANNSDAWNVGATCNTSCTGPGPFCGDAVLDSPYEECDAGQADTVACDYDGGTGLEACSLPACGDGYVNIASGEVCDDGAADSRECDYGGGSGANACVPPVCGDGYLNAAAEFCELGAGCIGECGLILEDADILYQDLGSDFYAAKDVAIDGDTMVLAGYDDAAAVFYRDPGAATGWTFVTELVPDLVSTVSFGASATLSGDTAVIGAQYDSGPQDGVGIVFVFRKDHGGPDQWQQVTSITAGADAAPTDEFGWMIDLDGDTLAVAARSGDAWYVFYRDQGGASSWGEVTKISGQASSVAISGDTLVAGQNGDATVHYRHQGGTDNWGWVADLVGQAGSSTALAMDADTIIFGAPYDELLGAEAGAAFLYARDQGGSDAWGLVTTLRAFDGIADDHFGLDVAVDGDTVVVGSPGNWNMGPSQGYAYVFGHDAAGPGTWGQLAKLKASNGVSGDSFGSAVAVSGATVAIAAGYRFSYGLEAYLYELPP